MSDELVLWPHRCAGAALLAALFLVAPLAQPSLAHATSMRCGQRHVDRGDTTEKVERLCGSPQDRRQRTRSRTVRRVVHVPCGPEGRNRCRQVVEDSVLVLEEVWTYNLGPNKLIRFVIFEDGIVQSVRSGEYGD